MKFTYTKSYIRALCDRVIKAVTEHQEQVHANYRADFLIACAAYSQLKWYEKLFASPPVDITDYDSFDAARENSGLADKIVLYQDRCDYIEELDSYKQEMRDARDILTALENNLNDTLDMPLYLITKLVAASKCMDK